MSSKILGLLAKEYRLMVKAAKKKEEEGVSLFAGVLCSLLFMGFSSCWLPYVKCPDVSIVCSADARVSDTVAADASMVIWSKFNYCLE